MSFASNRRRRHGLGCAGATSLELALVVVVFLWIVMGVFDLARYLYTVQSMVTLMTDFGRYSIIQQQQAALISQGFSPGCGYTWSDTATSAPLLDPTQVGLCVNNFNVGVAQMQISVTYPFTAITPGLSMLTSTLTEQTTFAY